MSISADIERFILTELLDGTYPSPLGPSASLLGAGVLDSYGVVALLAFLQERYGIQITEEDLDQANFESVATIAALVSRKRDLHE